MKKLLSLILSLVMLLSAIPMMVVPASAETKLPSPDVLNGYENICLTYHFNPDMGNSYVRQSVADLLPYVAYLDTNGKIQDFFFDSYLFLPWNCSAPSGATMHGGVNNPTVATDWTAYIDDLFYRDKNVNALDQAMARAKNELNDSERKAGVFFTILYPAHNQTNFGSLGGRKLDLSKKADREYAIKWMIDEQINRFTQNGYDNLDLVGFYWLEEEIYSEYDQDMMLYASEYLHSLGLKFIWIPWFQAPGYNKWQDYGFDVACLQPNEIWQSTTIPRRVQTCADLCERYGMSMQIESRQEVSVKEYYDRYLKYIYGGMMNGHMDSVKFYYQDGKTGVYYNACYSNEALFRSVYDLTYKYATGTLTENDIDLGEAPPFSIPEDVDWVSYGKSYTGCESFVDGNGMPYQEVDGKELTDGVIGTTTNGTEWHAYHISILDDEGRMSTTLDLGEVYTDLTHVMAHFREYQPFNIGGPADMKLYISEDGENFDFLTTATIKQNEEFLYFKYTPTEPFSARYVKMSFTNNKNNFVFCSEFMVGRVKTEDDEPSDPSVPTDDQPDLPVEPDHSHSPGSDWDHDDENHWQNCDCGERVNEDEHDPDAWEVTEQPSVENEGTEVKRCKVCGRVLSTRDIPKLDFPYGDVNRNGELDSMDYVYIKRNYFGTFIFDKQQEIIADINNSGKVDSMDYILAKRIYFGTYKK